MLVVLIALLAVGVRLLVLVLMALSQYQVFYAQEARPYVFYMLAVSASWVLLLEAAERKKSVFWISYGVVTVLTIWLQYLLWLSIVAQAAWLFHQGYHNREFRRWVFRPMLISFGIFLLASIPMMVLFFSQARDRGGDWIPPLSISNMLYLVESMACGFKVLLPKVLYIVCGLLALVCWTIFAVRRPGKRPWANAVLYAALLPVIMLVIVSFYKPLIYQGRRYVCFCQPFLVVALAGGILAMPRWPRRLTATAFILLWAAMSIGMYRQVDKRRYDLAATRIMREAQPGDRILVIPDYSYEVMKHYEKNLPPPLEEHDKPWQNAVHELIISGNRLWVVSIGKQISAPERFIQSYTTRDLSLAINIGPYLRLARYRGTRETSENKPHD